jgi:hypothetical protein
MPDITMCAHELCPLAAKCRRSEKSGTVPDSEWQSYIDYARYVTLSPSGYSCEMKLDLPKKARNDNR